MKLESIGIIISLRPFGERDAVAHIFSSEYGMLVGMIKGAFAIKKNKPLVGQYGNVSWNARLESQLGMFHFESLKNLSAPLMFDSCALPFMNSAFALLSTLLPERVKYDTLFTKTMNLLAGLAHADVNVSAIYLDWEILLLSDLGYALDFSRCSGCGQRNNLVYLSPKTGRAVCKECGAKYASRLFMLPPDLDATKYFLCQIITEHGGQDLPLARNLIS